MKNSKKMLRHICTVLAGALFLAISAQMYIPLQVPITMHTVAVLLLSFLCSTSKTMQIITAYIIMIALNLPVLSEKSGISILLGPTGGYLFGFFLCAYAISIMKRLWKDKLSCIYIIYGILGSMLILISGGIRLSNFVGIEIAISKGITPLLIPAILKAILAFVLALGIAKLRDHYKKV